MHAGSWKSRRVISLVENFPFRIRASACDNAAVEDPAYESNARVRLPLHVYTSFDQRCRTCKEVSGEKYSSVFTASEMTIEKRHFLSFSACRLPVCIS